MTGIVDPCFGKNFNDLALCSEGSISKPHMDRSSRLCRDSLFLATFWQSLVVVVPSLFRF